MEVKIGQIQPTVDPRVVPEFRKKQETPAIPPVKKSEGTDAQKLTGERDGQLGDSQTSAVSLSTIEGVAKDVESYLEDLAIGLNFQIEDRTGELVVQVIKRETGDVVRQIPPEQLLKLREKLEELRGVLFDGKV